MDKINTQINDNSHTDNDEKVFEYIVETKTEDLERIFSHLREMNFEQNKEIVKRQPRFIPLAVIDAISLILVPLFLEYAKSSQAYLSWISLIFAMIFTLIYLAIPFYFLLGGVFDDIDGESFEESSQAGRLAFNLKLAISLKYEVENYTVSADKVGLLKAFSALIKNEIDHVSEASNIYGIIFTAALSITLAASLITNDPDTTVYKTFSIILAGVASGFVVIIKGKAVFRARKLKKWLLISDMAQGV